jgi:methylthioribose-1-phosphate isomerase
LVRNMHTIEWDSSKKELRTIDQRLLPGRLEFVILTDYYQVAQAIQNMTLRGAPIIGVAAAFGLVLAAFHSKSNDLITVKAEIQSAAQELQQARPTAVNLSWAIKRILTIVDSFSGSSEELCQKVEKEAQRMADEDIQTNLAISRNGSRLIQDGDTIIHHCNTGALATVDWGTALGVIRMAFEQGKHIKVLVDETRPRLQGARLTAWELQQYKIPFDVICDDMAGYFLHKRIANKVLFGADRVARNGDVANKIGSYMLALAANANNVPVYSVFPTSTVDLTLENGEAIPIEERDPCEVLDIQLHGEQVMPAGATARNPAFDITPHELLSGYITEVGVLNAPFEKDLMTTLQQHRS